MAKVVDFRVFHLFRMVSVLPLSHSIGVHRLYRIHKPIPIRSYEVYCGKRKKERERGNHQWNGNNNGNNTDPRIDPTTIINKEPIIK